MTNAKNVTAWRQRTKEKSLALLGGKCSVCGYKKCRRALDFHHIDPLSKTFSISGKGVARAWHRIQEELKNAPFYVKTATAISKLPKKQEKQTKKDRAKNTE